MIEGGKESKDSFLTFVRIHRFDSLTRTDKPFDPGWSFLRGLNCLQHIIVRITPEQFCTDYDGNPHAHIPPAQQYHWDDRAGHLHALLPSRSISSLHLGDRREHSLVLQPRTLSHLGLDRHLRQAVASRIPCVDIKSTVRKHMY